MSVVFLSRELTPFVISFAKTHLLLKSLDTCHWLCDKAKWIRNEVVLENEGFSNRPQSKPMEIMDFILVWMKPSHRILLASTSSVCEGWVPSAGFVVFCQL